MASSGDPENTDEAALTPPDWTAGQGMYVTAMSVRDLAAEAAKREIAAARREEACRAMLVSKWGGLSVFLAVATAALIALQIAGLDAAGIAAAAASAWAGECPPVQP